MGARFAIFINAYLALNSKRNELKFILKIKK